MKDEILKTLSEKFPSVSIEILDRIATSKSKTITKKEEVGPLVDGITIQNIIESEADRRATEASKTAVINYEKKHGLKEGKPITGGDAGNEPEKGTSVSPSAGGGDAQDMEQRIQQLIKASVEAVVAPLQQRVATLLQEKEQDAFSRQLQEAIASAPEKFKSRVLEDVQFMRFENDEQRSAFIEKVKARAAEEAAEAQAKGAVFGVPFVSSGAPKGTIAPVAEDQPY